MLELADGRMVGVTEVVFGRGNMARVEQVNFAARLDEVVVLVLTVFDVFQTIDHVDEIIHSAEIMYTCAKELNKIDIDISEPTYLMNLFILHIIFWR